MTNYLMIDDTRRGKAITGVTSLAPTDGITARLASFVLPRERWVTANKCIRLAAFGVVWALANMILIEAIFGLAFNQHPYPFLNLFTATP
jgi:hypothetical protein